MKGKIGGLLLMAGIGLIGYAIIILRGGPANFAGDGGPNFGPAIHLLAVLFGAVISFVVGGILYWSGPKR